MRIRIGFEPRDLWIGVYLDRDRQWGPAIIEDQFVTYPVRGTRWTAYLCLLPMLPIMVTWVRGDWRP